ncbi:MAG: dipeptide ABC transporter ATP-binding protein [Pseudomonadota bacterium]
MTGLDVEGLGLSIGAVEVLRDVSLSVAPGEIFGLIGESGSGKSMTALALMDLLPKGSARTGTIRLDGAELSALGERGMRRVRGNDISMIFQEPMTALNPLQTIGDQVMETVRVHTGASRAEARARAREVLDRVGLPADRFPLARYPHELSGGQRQRVVIALAIALRPKLLIADEPTTALDVTTQSQILALLKGLVEEDGMSLILITHDLAVVSGLADRIAIMRRGEVVEAGPAGQVFAAQRHPYTRTLLAASVHQPDRHGRGQGAPVLEVNDAVRDYTLPRRGLFDRPGRFRAVDHVSFTLHQGENLGLVGESGCGKSTLARAILGLEPLQGGRIALGGQDVSPAMRPEARRRISVVFQDPYGSFNPRHSVGRLVAEPFHLLTDRPTDRRDRVAEALEAVGLEAADATKYIHEFSGGQRQRIAIARALIIRPDVIVLDEAVSALDVSVRARVLDLLAALSESHALSYLFISHDLTVVRAITDRVLVMRAGRIVEEGPTGAVFTSPRHAYTQSLLAAAPRLDPALVRVDGAGASGGDI